MECPHQKRADISLKNLWQGRLKGRGAVKSYLPINTAKLEIPVGKSNGLYLSVWETSENMGCDLCQFFSSFQSVKVIWIYFVAVCSPHQICSFKFIPPSWFV